MWCSPPPCRAPRAQIVPQGLLLKVLNTATQELKIVTVISQRVKQTILKYHLLSHLKAVGYVFFPLYSYIQSSDLEKPIQ